MKKNFLVVYDYGMGGVWAIIRARTKEEITQKYPMLIVRDSRPSAMTDEDFNVISLNETYDIDDPPTGWLLTALKS
jgi:hypothetical protein